MALEEIVFKKKPQDLLSLNIFGIINPTPLRMHPDLRVKNHDLCDRSKAIRAKLRFLRNKIRLGSVLY